MLLFVIGSESCRKDFSKEIYLRSKVSQPLYIPQGGGQACFTLTCSPWHTHRPGMEQRLGRLNAQMCICSLRWWFLHNKISNRANFFCFVFKLILLHTSDKFFVLSWILIWFSNTLYGFAAAFCILWNELQLIAIVLDGSHLIKHTVIISWR